MQEHNQGFGKVDRKACVGSIRRVEIPMTTFDKREAAFEGRFAQDEKLRFKALARRDRKLGQWAAGLLGKTGSDAEAYVTEVVASDFEKQREDDVFARIRTDLDAAGVKQSDHQIRRTMEELLAVSLEELRAEG